MAATRKTRGARGDGRSYQRLSGAHADKNKWYREIWVTDPDTGKLKRKTFSAPNRSAANKAARDWQDAHPGGVAPSTKLMTVAGAVDDFLDHYEQSVEDGIRRANTLETLKYAARHIREDPVGKILVAELKADHVNQMVLRMAKGWGMERKLSSSYIHQIRSLLSQAVKRAGSRVVADSEPVSVRGKERDPLTEADMIAILKTAKARSPQDYGLIAVLNMGLRRGEVLGLRWSDIRFDIEMLHVREQYLRQGGRAALGPLKTDESDDTLAMPGHTVEALRDLRANRPASEPGDFVFLSSAGTPVDPSNFYHLVQRIGRQAGIKKNVHPHAFRHEMVTTLLKKGFGVAFVQKMARHADPRTTLAIYAHLQSEDLRDVARALNRSQPEMATDLAPGV
jgi:integrase